MAIDEAEARRARLVESLGRLTALLDDYFSYRAPVLALSEIRDQIAAGDSAAAADLKSKFGGMGSLNDFYLQGNPQGSLTADERSDVDARYRKTRDDVYDNLLQLLAASPTVSISNTNS